MSTVQVKLLLNKLEVQEFSEFNSEQSRHNKNNGQKNINLRKEAKKTCVKRQQ